MHGFKDQTTYQYDRLQVLPRMRVPPNLLKHTLQTHVINAIRRNREVDKDDLYGRALADLTGGENSAVLDDFSELVERAVSGKLKGHETAAAERTFSGLPRLSAQDDAYPNIFEFNRRFLNGRGSLALLTLLTLEAAKLDLGAVDTFRAGDALDSAYGPRRTRRQKELGTELQALLKQLAVVDEPAMMEAADRYIDYRFLDHGSLTDYKRRKELEGDPRSDRHLRDWFKKFDRALGFPPSPSGRPRKKRR